MKMKKILAIGLAFVMAFISPTAAGAQEIIGVTEQETEAAREEAAGEDIALVSDEAEVSDDAAVVTALEGQEPSEEQSADEPQDMPGEEMPEDQEEFGQQEVIEVIVPESLVWDELEDMEMLQDKYHVDFELSSAQMADKLELYDVLDGLWNAVPGRDYLENQIVIEASDEGEAEEIAKGFGGELLSFQDGIAVVETEISTLSAVALAADKEIRLPAAYPNFVYTTDDAKYETTDLLSDFNVDVFQKQMEGLDGQTDKLMKELGVEEINLPEGGKNSNIIFEEITGTGTVSSNDPDLDKQWFHQRIDTFNAWKVTKGAGVTVAVLDSGINLFHEEFMGKSAGSVSAINKVTTGLIQNGYNWMDNHGHGTHVAGIIGAAANNGAGGVGIAPEVNILSVKVLEYDASSGSSKGNTGDIVAAISYATSQDVDIINMSLGGGATEAIDILYQKVVDEAVAQGVTVIVSAGNDSMDISKKENRKVPACLNGVITVSSLDRFGDLSIFSNYGKIDVAAPGGTGLEDNSMDIYSTSINNSGYKYLRGTSQACPVVAGIAALIIASGTAEGPQAVEAVLKSSCINIGNKKYFGAGLVNAAAAVNAISIYTKDSNFNVAAGKSLKLMAKTNSKSVKPVWTVSDNSVGTISKSGVFKAAKSITAKTEVDVTAACNGRSDTVTITVYPKAGTITGGGKKSMTLQWGGEARFIVTSDLPCTYKSSNNKVAIVDSNGRIYAKSNGKATITATTVGGKKITVKVKVTGTPFLIKGIVAVKERDERGAYMFAQSPMGSGTVAYPLSAGKSIKFKVVSSWPYNTSSDKKVKWVCGGSGEIKNGTFRLDKHIETGRLISIIAVPEKGYGGGKVQVAGFQPIKGFNFTDTGKKSAKTTSVTIAAGGGINVPYEVIYKKGANKGAMNPYPYIESSDSDIATGACSVSNGQLRIAVTGKRAGTCKLTLVSMDGAYRTATIDVTVY